ncbi:hypothetical protein DSECCO2_576600 [anaerobic digester metagenome]
MVEEAFAGGDLVEEFLVLAALGLLDEAVQARFEDLRVGEDEFGFDDVDVAGGVHGAGDVDDVVVFEGAGDVDDDFGFADVGQEFVAQALALARSGDEAGDVGEAHGGGHDLRRVDERGQGVEAGVRHGHDGHVGLDGAERVVGGLCVLGFGQGVEQGGFADVGQAHDADGNGHGGSSFCGGACAGWGLVGEAVWGEAGAARGGPGGLT